MFKENKRQLNLRAQVVSQIVSKDAYLLTNLGAGSKLASSSD